MLLKVQQETYDPLNLKKKYIDSICNPEDEDSFYIKFKPFFDERKCIHQRYHLYCLSW